MHAGHSILHGDHGLLIAPLSFPPSPFSCPSPKGTVSAVLYCARSSACQVAAAAVAAAGAHRAPRHKVQPGPRRREVASMNSTPLPDYYKTLSVSPSATTAEIKDAYRKESLRSHPDRFPHATPSE
ncbi:hypothetical protein K437DRAFT_258373 [Tilletiaria anomala UBC 951]|uniref:J domain-containing protein n=1 Tax=Tilletiaria anomala (strain ATCC 24038 / CBS 436.72 / UBC 951) TaxID=1037660 RepID=A0A066VRB9_TILAU|nr:uncharacterized protein K437DRAFT_258373 [Tilletiaria anomala UBC 951]KDN41135.1 hypothetical protein K437DRAFT_258373 [Tilletiaria anomala UBC 951]